MAEGPEPPGHRTAPKPAIASHTGTHVKKEALPRLMNVLFPVLHSWELLAGQIGVPTSQISLIRAAYPPAGPSSLYTCFTQALEWWVNNHDNPTYEAIIAVLDPKRGQTTPVMNRALAGQVKEFMAKEKQSAGSPTLSSHKRRREEVAVEVRSDDDEALPRDDYTEQNVMIIRRKFGNLRLMVCARLQKKLKKSQIKGALRPFILELFPDISPDLIPNTSNLEEIFKAIRRNHLWSYMNYFSLEQIVMQFGNDDPKMISEIEKFKKDRAGFLLATKIKNYIPKAKAQLHDHKLQPLHSVNPEHFTTLSYKLDECVAEYSLRYVEELWRSLSFHMQLPPIAMLFDVILHGSVEIVWLIPAKYKLQVIHQAKYSTHFYREHHILGVKIGGEQIYESKYAEKGIQVRMKETPEKVHAKSTSLASANAKGLDEAPQLKPKDFYWAR